MQIPSRPIQTNFTSGRLSRRLWGRVDLAQYQDAAAELLNVQVLPAGGATRRCGSAFATKVGDQGNRPLLVPFIVSNAVAYVLEFGNQYLRILYNRGVLRDAGGNVLQLATPYVTAVLGDLRVLRHAQSADVMYITCATYPPMQLARTAQNAFALSLVPFENGPYLVANTGDAGSPVPAATVTNPAAATPPDPPALGGTDSVFSSPN